MTETMLDRVARATETYAVVFTEKALVYKTDTIGTRMTKVVGEFDTAQEAKEACKRMNARAVLEALMEPGIGDGKIIDAMICASLECHGIHPDAASMGLDMKTRRAYENRMIEFTAAWTAAKQAMLTEAGRE